MLSGPINSRPHTSPWAPKRKERFGREMGPRLFQWNLGCCNNLGGYFCLSPLLVILYVFACLSRYLQGFTHPRPVVWDVWTINNIFKKTEGIQRWSWGIQLWSWGISIQQPQALQGSYGGSITPWWDMMRKGGCKNHGSFWETPNFFRQFWLLFLKDGIKLGGLCHDLDTWLITMVNG